MTSDIGGFFTAAVSTSGYVSGLNNDYSTVGKAFNQPIGKGSLNAACPVTITPSVTATALQDTDISAEIQKQVAAGKLPGPPGQQHLLPGLLPARRDHQPGRHPLVPGGRLLRLPRHHHRLGRLGDRGPFYATASTRTSGRAAAATPAAAAPPTLFDNMTSVASHELDETITDTAVGLATAHRAPARLVRQHQRRDRRHLQRPAGHHPGLRHARDLHRADGVDQQRRRLPGADRWRWPSAARSGSSGAGPGARSGPGSRSGPGARPGTPAAAGQHLRPRPLHHGQEAQEELRPLRHRRLQRRPVLLPGQVGLHLRGRSGHPLRRELPLKQIGPPDRSNSG